jgi:D-alanyl-D-alanine carboxypeptidase
MPQSQISLCASLLSGLLFATASYSLGCGSSPASPAPDAQSTFNSDAAVVDNQLDKQVAAAVAPAPFGSKALPGAVILVMDKGVVTSATSYGVYKFGGTDKPKVDGASRIGSATKAFVAIVVLQLVEEGKLALDQDFATLNLGLPQLAGVTIKQALSMTSGLADYVTDSFPNEVLMNPQRTYTNRQLAERGLALPPDFAPGTGWNYSNTNYLVLALAIEKVTNSTLSAEIKRRISMPLSLAVTALPLPNAGAVLQPALIGSFDGVDVSAIAPSYAGAAGAMTSTAAELAVYGRALSAGALVTNPMLRPEQQPHLDASSLGFPLRYGYGVMFAGKWTGHSGDVLGYTSAMFHLAEKDRSIVVLASGDFGGSLQIFAAVASALEPGSIPQ